MKHAGDPTPRSAGDVLADRAYKMVLAEADGKQPPTSVLVVMHCGTETYWSTSYLAAQARLAANWQRVAPARETRTIYRPVP